MEIIEIMLEGLRTNDHPFGVCKDERRISIQIYEYLDIRIQIGDLHIYI